MGGIRSVHLQRADYSVVEAGSFFVSGRKGVGGIADLRAKLTTLEGSPESEVTPIPEVAEPPIST